MIHLLPGVRNPMSLCSDSPSAAASGHVSGSIGGCGEFMLFGVRINVDPLRKCVSLNNLSEYDEPVKNCTDPTEKSGDELQKVEGAEESGLASGYHSTDDAVPPPSKRSRCDRKRGVPWTEEEHKQFLIGLQKVGKGDWRGISKNYVKTRTPTQVASHAQKYFLRRSNLNRRRRRSSLFDITTDSVTEGSSSQQDAPASQVMPPVAVPQPLPTNACAFSVMPLPVAAAPVLFSMQCGNPLEDGSILFQPVIVHHVPTPSTTMDLNVNPLEVTEPSSLSLRLSLSSGADHPCDSLQVKFMINDSRISVA